MSKLNPKAETARQFCHLMYELRDQLRRFMQQKFRENGINLTYEMHQIMASLWKKDGVNQQVLADLTLKDKASMTYLIDNLIKRKLVTRNENPLDRRSKLIYLTEKGKILGEKIKPWVEELYTISGKDINISAISDSMKLVEKMSNNIRRV